MSAAQPVVPAKVLWLKHVGQVIGKILRVVSKDAAPIADEAAAVAEAILPQFAPQITIADSLIDRIAKQAVITEGIAAAAASPVSGQSKLDTVLSSVGPEIDAWVASKFPGASQVSTAAKAGLINAVVAITNELEAKPGVTAVSVTTGS